ncbi:hypothetical protein D3C73_388170 [compost metagenome]
MGFERVRLDNEVFQAHAAALNDVHISFCSDGTFEAWRECRRQDARIGRKAEIAGHRLLGCVVGTADGAVEACAFEGGGIKPDGGWRKAQRCIERYRSPDHPADIGVGEVQFAHGEAAADAACTSNQIKVFAFRLKPDLAEPPLRNLGIGEGCGRVEARGRGGAGQGEIQGFERKTAWLAVDRPCHFDRSLGASKACSQAVVTLGVPRALGGNAYGTRGQLAALEIDAARFRIGCRDIDIGRAVEQVAKCGRHQSGKLAAAFDLDAVPAIIDHHMPTIDRDNRLAVDIPGKLASPVGQRAFAVKGELHGRSAG